MDRQTAWMSGENFSQRRPLFEGDTVNKTLMCIVYMQYDNEEMANEHGYGHDYNMYSCIPCSHSIKSTHYLFISFFFSLKSRPSMCHIRTYLQERKKKTLCQQKL